MRISLWTTSPFSSYFDGQVSFGILFYFQVLLDLELFIYSSCIHISFRNNISLNPTICLAVPFAVKVGDHSGKFLPEPCPLSYVMTTFYYLFHVFPQVFRWFSDVVVHITGILGYVFLILMLRNKVLLHPIRLNTSSFEECDVHGVFSILLSLAP